MKTLKKLLLFVVASALLAGCTSYKNVPYMQNPEVVNSLQGKIFPFMTQRLCRKIC